jgi:hypothetical protein
MQHSNAHVVLTTPIPLAMSAPFYFHAPLSSVSGHSLKLESSHSFNPLHFCASSEGFELGFTRFIEFAIAHHGPGDIISSYLLGHFDLFG